MAALPLLLIACGSVNRAAAPAGEGVIAASCPEGVCLLDANGARASVVHTQGNPDCQIILRGGRTPNYDRASIEACERLLATADVPVRILVDCSHAQTGKDYSRQPEVLAEIVAQVSAGSRSIMGFMLESNIAGGNQPLARGREGLRYGVSVTDACLDWETTERCLSDAAEALGSF